MTGALIFTVEELSLIAVFAAETRDEVIDHIFDTMPSIIDSDTRRSAESVAAKLIEMSDEEFSEISISEED